MYFKKLELIGFKSFCDKTTLNFEPGITAVVGPNGCGKSNVVDSLRWVLGEQSAKSLRGSEMLDVIFNGTDNKEPLGMAEVSLTFDNSSHFFNLDSPEVLITRRLFRSGESEYMLNKSTVRLKDILDILLGTGIGAESYSIIAQGKIDLVLSSRPEDRRIVFDEASGISKYKAQKRETTRKLDETEQNLLRVNDIVTEVRRQIGSLERQAAKARKYKEIFEELKLKEISLATLDKKNLLKEKDEQISQLADLQKEEAALVELVALGEEKIANRQSELKTLEQALMDSRGELLNLENSLVRNNEHINFNQQSIDELAKNYGVLSGQIDQARAKLIQDEEKLQKVRDEYDSLKENIDSKQSVLEQKEGEINKLGESIKSSLEVISESKKIILDLEGAISNIHNEIGNFNSKHQVFLARKKRLEIEKAKVYEEKAITEEMLKKVSDELAATTALAEEFRKKISDVKISLQQEGQNLGQINKEITDLENQKITLASHKEFLEKLKSKYDDIGETLNAVIYLDKAPSENLTGLVVKIQNQGSAGSQDNPGGASVFKMNGEAKPIELDTRKIDEKILKIEEDLGELKNKMILRQACISELTKMAESLQQELRNHEITLANKESNCRTTQEQFDKIKEEEDVIVMELSDLARQIAVIEQNLATFQDQLSGLNNQKRVKEDLIGQEEDNIALNSKAREEVLVLITQTKTEIEALNKRFSSDQATLKILEETYAQDKGSLENIQRQISQVKERQGALKLEITQCRDTIKESEIMIAQKKSEFSQVEVKYNQVSGGTMGLVKKIEADRKLLDQAKNKLHDLEMRAKDLDYRYATIKERMLSSYKVDLDLENTQEVEALDPAGLTDEINELKRKLDSCGTVNLVAIEEYDELKKRYDFLIQQQADLAGAKESLHQAILKINRTTRQMFVETFEKVKIEFKNYFRLLFNGGDAQLFLLDESDPLESGIEIICRPPGKKLQNVLLLSGGEKTMSAIALIFAIFKVKPSPFCILDEIDAALDEANVDRFSRVLQEFSKSSQFIVITHNKKTIVNANIMYGITMEESGVSRIVSVRLSQDKEKDKLEQAVLSS